MIQAHWTPWVSPYLEHMRRDVRYLAVLVRAAVHCILGAAGLGRQMRLAAAPATLDVDRAVGRQAKRPRRISE
jgi:hypothetical protein